MSQPQSDVASPSSKSTARWQWGALWHHPNFMKFWIGQTISIWGDQFTLLALPLTAVLVLNVNAEQLGVLSFLGTLPFLVFPLVVSPWVDRRRKRPLMIVANAIRAILIGAIPLSALLHLISLHFLYIIAFCVGLLSVLFELCWYSYIPTLVEKDHLIEANSKIWASTSAGQVAGSGLVGFLVVWLTAPLVLFFDSISYVVSVVSLLLISSHEPTPEREQQSHWLKDVGEGLRFTFGNVYLRTTALLAAGWNVCEEILTTIFLLYAVRQLHLSLNLLGLIYAVGLVGGVIGFAYASTLASRFRLGAIIFGSFALGAISLILIPIASGSQPLVVALCMISFFSMRTGEAIYNVLKISLRQAVTPAHLQGRTYASLWILSYSGIALGPLIAGFLGTVIGLHPTLWVACCGFAMLILLCFFSPLRRLQAFPVLTDK